MTGGRIEPAGAVILACEMIEDEVRLALEAVAPEQRPPLVWVESGLHDRPERLQAALQALLDLLDEGVREGVAVEPPVGSSREGTGLRTQGRGARQPRPRSAPRPRFLRQRAAGTGLPVPDPGVPAGGRLRLATAQPRLFAGGDPSEPAQLLPDQGLVRPRQLDGRGFRRLDRYGTASSALPSCARPCSPATSGSAL